MDTIFHFIYYWFPYLIILYIITMMNVQILFKYVQTCIKTNGFVSKYFNISRSCRQGCPIAPLVYILQAEPVACAIRGIVKYKESNYLGGKMGNISRLSSALNTWSTHPHSSRLKAFCWSKNIMIPSSSSRSVYSITSCIRRLACRNIFRLCRNDYKRCILLFKYAHTCIKTNGFVSKYFYISRSCRKGYPITPLVYILKAEPVACAIRGGSEIQGVKLRGGKMGDQEIFH
jgi:hypothetical protein